jgi:hypothetical protein
LNEGWVAPQCGAWLAIRNRKVSENFVREILFNSLSRAQTKNIPMNGIFLCHTKADLNRGLPVFLANEMSLENSSVAYYATRNL